MGEAKRRGSLEVRVKEGIKKQEEIARIREEEYQKYLDNLSPIQKKNLNNARKLLAMGAAFTASSFIERGKR